MSSGISRLDASGLTRDGELTSQSHLLAPAAGTVDEGGYQYANSQYGNSTLNDRATDANHTMVQQVPQDPAQPSFGHLWRDADGDYSSDDDEENQKEEDEKILNKVRVVVRVRPLIQGESNM